MKDLCITTLAECLELMHGAYDLRYSQCFQREADIPLTPPPPLFDPYSCFPSKVANLDTLKCESIPIGSISEDGVNLVQCKWQNAFANMAQTRCVIEKECDIGSFANPFNYQCQTCSSKMYVLYNHSGCVNNLNCGDGFVANFETYQCVKCPSIFPYRNLFLNSCIIAEEYCETGTFLNSTSKTCEKCPNGSIVQFNEYNKRICVICETGLHANYWQNNCVADLAPNYGCEEFSYYDSALKQCRLCHEG